MYYILSFILQIHNAHLCIMYLLVKMFIRDIFFYNYDSYVITNQLPLETIPINKIFIFMSQT